MSVSGRALTTLAQVLRRHRYRRATRRRKLSAGRQALLVVAYLGKGETYTDLACGFELGTSTVYRYIRESLALLAAMAPTPEQAIEVARGKAFVIQAGVDAFMLALRQRSESDPTSYAALLNLQDRAEEPLGPGVEESDHERRDGRVARPDRATSHECTCADRRSFAAGATFIRPREMRGATPY